MVEIERSIMKVAITGADSENPNRGLGALTYGTVSVLSKILENAEIYFFDYYKKHPGKRMFNCNSKCVTVDTFPLRFSWRLNLRNNIFTLLLAAFLSKMIFLRRVMYRFFPTLEKMEEVNAFFIMSGGDSFSDIYGIKRFFYVALPQLLILIMNKPLILLPQTIGPFKKKYAQIISSYILKHAKRVFSRDRMGVEYAQGINRGQINKVGFCYDLGFLLEPQSTGRTDLYKISKRSNNNVIVGLNVSGLLINGGYTKKNQFGLSSDYMELNVAIVESLLKHEEVMVCLVPHVFGQTLENDFVASRAVLNGIKPELRDRVVLFDEEFTAAEVKSVIGRCDLFIGARMHACIAAISQCIPAIPLGYSDKFMGVIKSIGLDDVVQDMRTIKPESILNNIDTIFEKREDIRTLLCNKIPEVKLSIEKLFGELLQEIAEV